MKTILKAYKYRLYSNKEQCEFFNKCFGCARLVYNLALNDRIKYYKETGKSLKNGYSDYLIQYPFLKEVDSQALVQSINDLNTAYKKFFTESNINFPKFKSKHSTNSYRSRPLKNMINGNKIKLPKIGLVKFANSQNLPKNSIIRNFTILKTVTDKYFISILVAEEYEPLESTGNIIGIDLGIKDLIITSDGDKFENIKTTSKYSKKLAQEQRKLSKMKNGSNNYKKQKIKVAKVYEKITNTRKDYLHKISYKLISENQAIISENLKVSNMVKNHKLAKSIEDCSWSMLINFIQYKSDWNDRNYLKVDTFFPSSKICNNCGYKYNDLTLNIREWTCPSCGQQHDRDINAAINIRDNGIKIFNS